MMASLVTRGSAFQRSTTSFVKLSPLYYRSRTYHQTYNTAIRESSSNNKYGILQVCFRRQISSYFRSNNYNINVMRYNRYVRRFTSGTNNNNNNVKNQIGRDNKQTFLEKFLAPKPMPERNTAAWYREMILICTVFGITGSSTMLLVRPAVSNVLGIQGTLKDGPWSYRICSIVIMTPIYASLLVVIGTIFGRHAYFRHFSVKIFSRFGIPPELMDKNFQQTKQTFRKW